MKFKSLEHFIRDIMEKKNVSDFERQLNDMKKHMNSDGVSLNPNYAKLEKDQTATDSNAIDKETDKSVADITADQANATNVTNTDPDQKDNNITDTTKDIGKAQSLERAQRILKIRNIRAQNKIKIIDNV